MVRSVGRVALAAVALWLTVAVTGIAVAQDRRQNQPGQFDFYVLSLSWSPSFCEAAGERGTPPQQQCGARPYSFVVHGLWPQYERGFPEFCQQPAPRLDRHSTCSGLSPNAYFENVRKARAAVKIPDAYIAPSAALTVTPDEVEEAFVQANPGLSRDGIAVTCRSRRLGEVRICLGKDLRFRACPDIDARACRRDELVMPPVRGGSAALGASAQHADQAPQRGTRDR